jgi:regulator of RNase E activity RraA
MTKQEQGGRQQLSDVELLQLKRWNTPTIYNGWEQITRHDAGKDCFNLEEVHDFMPHMGPMVGYAVTLVIEPSNPAHRRSAASAWRDYRAYVGQTPGQKIVVVQDVDKPRVMGALWGEVASTFHRALGCVGTITDGGIRDLDEINSVGFKALARRLCPGHAYVAPVRWGDEVEVFGRKIQPGQLIHADKHGFLAVPPEDEAQLLEAARFMDDNECQTVLAAARAATGKSTAEILADLDSSIEEFTENVISRFGRKGEWR